ncbi:MAG: hypothetical protein JXR39_11610 [Marinilabiliaceae bacterium]|nr:hypothetical protein [Marinilabiliaceae bacterium]
MSKKNTTIELSVIERIGFQQLIPEQGSFADLLHGRNILKKIEIGSEEAARLELRSEGERVVWKAGEAKPLSVSFSPVELEVIRKQIDKLDKEERIHISMFELIEKLKA